MLGFVFRKMKNSRWMTASLLLGNLLLFCVVSAIPIYTDGVLQSVMTDSLEAIQASGEVWSGSIHTSHVAREARGYQKAEQVFRRAEALSAEYDVPLLAESKTRSSYAFRFSSLSDRSQTLTSRSSLLRCRTDFADHIEIISGRLGADELVDGAIEVAVNAATLARQDLMLGERFVFETLTDPSGEPYQFVVVGVFRRAEETDPYWYTSPELENDVLMVSSVLFDKVLGDEYRSRYSMEYVYDAVLDVHELDVAQVEQYAASTQAGIAEMEKLGATVDVAFAKTLQDFLGQEGHLTVLLWLLLAPILVMLVLFLFMVSRQILEQEKQTIAVIKSRGAGRAQVVGLYAMQSAVLSLIATVLGIPLGMLLCRVIGASNGFMNLVQRTSLPLRLVPGAFTYSAAALVLSVLTMTLPAVAYSRESIVSHKRAGSRHGVLSLTAIIAVALVLGVSLYGWYSFQNQVTAVIGSETKIDPLLYVSASAFLLGSGVAVALILPAVIRLLYRLGRSIWSAQLYAAFLRSQRAGTDQRFLMVFLVLTIAVGIFNATTARTINQNTEDNLSYRNGADMVLKQVWKDGYSDEAAQIRYYEEPDFGPYERLKASQENLNLTKVLNSDKYTVAKQKTGVMGIDTAEFGAVAWMRDKLLPGHFYDYLNALSQDASAVLLSENYRDDGYALGDRIEIVNENGVSFLATVYGFFEYWPSYFATDIEIDYWGEQSLVQKRLVVGNLSQMQAVWGVEPYEIWIKTENADPVYTFAEEEGLQYTRFSDTAADLVDAKNDPALQGTNGVLTVGFIMVLAVCMAGFMIFWILSIRSRTLQFGVFRAMGMSMADLLKMLFAEQVMVSLTSVAAGALVGVVASRLYVPLIQLSYSSMDINLPLQIVAQRSDYLRLFGVFGAIFVICLVILSMQVRNIRIAQALKLGED